MASGTTPKIRFVRCPKCLLVLPEVEDLPVYKCGGCDTILAAKNRKAIVESTSCLEATKAALSDKLVHAFEHGESSSSTPKEVLPSTPEYHLTQESDSPSGKGDENSSIEGQYNDQNTSSDTDHSNCAKLDENGSNEGLRNGSGQLQLESLENCNVHQPGESIESFLSTELHHDNEELMLLVADANLEAEANDKTSQLEEAYSELETNKKTDSNIKGLSIDNNLSAATEINLTVTACAAAGEVISSDNLFSSPSKHLKQSQKSEHLGFDSARSTDSFETADFVSPSLELSGLGLEYLSKSTTTRTSHAYDGNISSYDGMDDHFPDHQIHSFKNNFKAANYLVPEERHRTDKLPGNDMLVADANLEAEANDKTVQLEEAYSELETNKKIDSNIEGSSIDNNLLAATEINLTVTACAAAGEVISSDNLFSSPSKHLEQSQKSEHQGFDSASSTDSFETADFVSPRSELSAPDLEYLSKSNATRTSHAYDGSISSYDGMDDHFLDHQIHSFKNNFKAANNLVPEERHRMDKLPGNDMMNGNSGMQDHARNLSSDLSNKKHYATAKDSEWHRGEAVEEPVMHQRPPRNWPRLESDEYPSDQIPVSQRASLRGYANAGPSHSAFNPLEKAECSEQENMKLLRMVYELQDQISKACHLNGKPNRRTSIDVPWRQKHFPTSYHQEPPEEGKFYPRHHGRRGHRSSWSSQQSRFSRIPYSGGAINTSHDIDNSCLCRHRQAWPNSEQLPPPIFRHNRGFCRAQTGHSCYNSYSSCPSSPQRYLGSDFSIWSHVIKSDDQSHRDHELRRYLRERRYSVRRHRRPTAGGAPFVTCYNCFRPLELPADFLLFKRRFHQLRCGACLKVLTFSLQKGIHLVPSS